MIQGLDTVLDGVIETATGGWRALLASMDGETRLYDLSIEGFTAPLWVESFIGREVVSTITDYRIHALSTDAALDLGALRWRRTRLRIRLADGSEHMRSGHIRAVQTRRSDGGLARYTLHLTSWNWLLTQQSHSRLWQDQPLTDILGDVFAAYPDAQWGYADGTETVVSAIPVRNHCVQYRETDHDFISRLLAEEGLGWTFEESDDDTVSARLVIFADSTRFPEVQAAEGIRFHRAAAAEQGDTLQGLSPVHRLPANAASLAGFDPATKRSQVASTASAITPSDGDKTPSRLERYRWGGHSLLTDPEEAARRSRLMQDAQDARRSQFQGSGNVRNLRMGSQFKLTESLLDGFNPSAATSGSDRNGLAVLSLHCAGINNLPSDPAHAARDMQRTAESDWLTSADDRMDTSGLQTLLQSATEHGYASQLDLQPASIPWRPIMAGQRQRVTAPGPQSATVVDASGSSSGSEEIHRDRLNRIRVRFHWQQDPGNDSAHTSPASTWLRIASRAAGPGRGASFVPRLGQEVLVGFLDQDIDQPLIIGALYNGRGEGGDTATPAGQTASASDGSLYTQAQDRQASAQGNVSGGNSPAWHGHSTESAGHQNPSGVSGYKTQEFGGGGQGYNHLALDDRDDALRIQLKTSQHVTELNLGQLIHQADNHLGSIRGTGFELRTDQGGTLRASKGILIESRRGQTPANNPEATGDFTAGISLLTQAQTLAKSYDAMATAHQATGLSLSRGSIKADSSRLDGKAAPAAALTKIAQSKVSGDDASPSTSPTPSPGPQGSATPVPHLGAAVVALSAKAQLGVVAGQAIQLAAGETIATLSGQDQDHAIGGSLTIHTGQSLGILAGIQQNASNPALSLITAQGPLRLEAQNATMNLDAKQALKLVSVSQSLEAAAKTAITLTTKAGAMIKIEGGNIQIHCPGQITVHAAQKAFTGATKMDVTLPQFPQTELILANDFPMSL